MLKYIIKYDPGADALYVKLKGERRRHSSREWSAYRKRKFLGIMKIFKSLEKFV